MEAVMKSTASAVLGAILAAGLALSPVAAQAAQKKEVTYVKTYSKSISKSSFAIDDVPNHEVVQEVLLQKSKYSTPDFDPGEEWIHIQTDQTGGSGSHKGYYIEIHAGGEQTYGTYRYVGGTGKYKNIKGGGTYKGRASPQEPFHEEGRQTIEY
jgi:hypothetical protein